MEPVAIAHAVNQFPDCKFNSGVGTLYPTHIIAAPLFRDPVGHYAAKSKGRSLMSLNLRPVIIMSSISRASG